MYFKAKFPETILFHKIRHPFTSGIAISNCLDSKCISKSYTRGKKRSCGVDRTEEKNDRKIIFKS